MELKLALIADYATTTGDGKLVVVGDFDTIIAPSAPVRHHRMFLIARFEAGVSEGTLHKLRIILRDEHGKPLEHFSIETELRFVPTRPGRPLVAAFLADLRLLEFPRYGDYEFQLLVDGRVAGSIPLTVTPPPQDPSP